MIKVFVAPVPFDGGSALPERLKNEIDGCTNEDYRAQKASAYSLLSFAVNKIYGGGLDGFMKNQNGKPSLPDCFVSLSHTAGAVAVALSDGEVGVDIENLEKMRYSPALAEKIMTAAELEEINASENRNVAFLKFWTARESAFKCGGDGAFNPREAVNGYIPIRSYKAALNGDFALSVAGEGEAEITVLGGGYKMWQN